MTESLVSKKKKKVHRMFRMLCSYCKIQKFYWSALSADEEDLDRSAGVLRVQTCRGAGGRQAGMGRGHVLAPGHEVCGWLVGVMGGASERSGGHFLHSSALSENGAAHRFQYGGNVPVQGGVRRSHGPLSEHRRWMFMTRLRIRRCRIINHVT